jgi:hypothetical protein
MHPLWPKYKSILKQGSNWPLEEISKEARQQDVLDALTFGNHKGALAKPDLLCKLIGKDVKFGYSFTLPLSSITLIPGICIAPMNIMAQNTIDEFGRIMSKDRLTHDQSWKWSSGISVNSRIIKELLLECRYGYCIRQLINWAVAARRKYPGQRILASKIDYKSAYRRGIFHFATALRTVTQLPEDELAILALHLTFGGAPCPFKWGVILETICDLANKLLKCQDWEPTNLHALVQHKIPKRIYLDKDIPFTVGRELIVDIPIDHQGYTNFYINGTTGLTIDLPGTRNVNCLGAAIPLGIEVAARPNDINEPIPREPMVAQDKLKAEGGLAETKVILGWQFNFRTLTVTLLEHKHIAWSTEICKMLADSRTLKRALESMIGQLGHLGFVIPWVYHFLSHLWTLLARARNKRTVKINKACMSDLELM